ncbi:MAG: hypothetical protein ACYC2K_07665, partial [Gemmatimonadales bacterium]
MTQVPHRPGRIWAAVAIVALAATGTILGPTQASWAQDYPSWSEVQNARNDETVKKAQVAQLEALLRQLEASV